jgi:hypothetical protein
MRDKERIKVFVRIENGRTVCICKRDRKRCKRKGCSPEVVERDRFAGWEGTFCRDRYGKSK